MTYSFIVKLVELLKRREAAVKKTEGWKGNPDVSDFSAFAQELNSIKYELELLENKCKIADIGQKYRFLQDVASAESEILNLFTALYERIGAERLEKLVKIIAAINNHFNYMLRFTFGREKREAKYRIIQAIRFNDFDLAVYLNRSSFFEEDERNLLEGIIDKIKSKNFAEAEQFLKREDISRFLNDKEVSELKKIISAFTKPREKKLRVLLIPMSWGFGPVSKGIAFINAMQEFDDVIEDAAILAAPEFCDFARKSYYKIRKYPLQENEIYDRAGEKNASNYVKNFIARFEQAVREFKPNVIVDSIDHLATILARIHGIKSIKIEHRFPELTNNESGQKWGEYFLGEYNRLARENRLSEFKEILIRYPTLSAQEWLGDALCDYLVIPHFYQLRITPSVLQHRGNKNIFWVNPCMSKQARLLLDDIFGTKSKMGRVLGRHYKKQKGIEGDFTRIILVNTGGLSVELKAYQKGWEMYFQAISGFAKGINAINEEFKRKKSKEKIGIVLIGALGKTKEFQEYMKKNWNKAMREILSIPGNVRSYNAIRLFLSADIIVTNVGQTSLSELLTLNRPFLFLPSIQREMSRNVEFLRKSGTGVELSALFDGKWNANKKFSRTIIDLLDQRSKLNSEIRNKQNSILSKLQDVNNILALVISDILGLNVYSQSSSFEEKTGAELLRKYYSEQIPWDKKFSVVVPVMDKEPEFLYNCLKSFRTAEPSPNKVEIIVVDFESKPTLIGEYKKICNNFNAIFHSIERRGRLFNLSLLRNYGARKASGDYIIFCDVDLITTSNVFEELKKAFLKEPYAYVVGRVYLDKQQRPKKFYESLTDIKLREIVIKEKLEFRPRSFGGFVVIDREWLYESRGFDEGYIHWGAEDDDFRFRSVFIKKKKMIFLDHFGYVSWNESAKFSTVDMLYPSDVVLLHQWHVKRTENGDERLKKIVEYNRARFNYLIYYNRVIYQNSKNWGTNKIKILFVLPTLYKGGVENVLVEQCKALLQADNFDIRVLATNATGTTYNTLIRLGVSVVIPKSSDEHPNFLAEREILFFKPEILYITNHHMAQSVERLKPIFKEVKIVYHMRGEKQWCINQVAAYSKNFDLLIVTYDSMYRLVKNYVNANKTLVIGNPIPIRFFDKFPSESHIICYSGRLDRGKCLGSFVKIISNVRKKIVDAEGLIIGDEEGMGVNIGVKKLIIDLSQKLKVPIRITGFVDNVEDYLSKSKVFLLTSSSEGFCNSVWEAVAVGLIPVTTRVGSLTTALYNKKDTYLCSIEHRGEIDLDFLPENVEEDLSKKCVIALNSKPDIKALKNMAMPFNINVWSKKFVETMMQLAKGLSITDLGKIMLQKVETEQKEPKKISKSESSQKSEAEITISKKYRLTTHSKSRYIAESQSEKWLIYKEGEEKGDHYIVWFGKFYERAVGIQAAIEKALGGESEHVKTLQENIGDALSRRTCIGQCAFYAREDHFDAVLKWKPRISEPKYWSQIKPFISFTTQIDKVEEISSVESKEKQPQEKSEETANVLLQNDIMTRRRFLRRFGVGAAAAVGAVAAGGAVKKMLESRGSGQMAAKEPAQIQAEKKEEPEPNFPDSDLRKSVNKVVKTEGKYREAVYIAVIPHSSELDSLSAARIAAKGPVTYLAGNYERNIVIPTQAGMMALDPNAIFSQRGVELNLKRLYDINWGKMRAEARKQIEEAVKNLVSNVSARIFRNKMVLALHQNTIKNFGIRSYIEDPRFSQYASEVYENPSLHGDYFAYTNSRAFFDFFKGIGYSAVLQDNNMGKDDGSIAYAATFLKLPYVNIEVRLGDSKKQAEILEKLNQFLEEYPEAAIDINFTVQIKIIQDPIVINDIRKDLTRDYSRFHYGIYDWRLINPRAIVVHSTNTDTYKQAHNMFYAETLSGRPDIQEGGRVNLSVHFIIDRDGRIYQQAPLDFMCRHAIGYNYTAIGIENVSTPSKLMTEKQIQSNARLIEKLVNDTKSISFVFPHSRYAEFPQSALMLSVGNAAYTPKTHPKIDPYGNDFDKIMAALPAAVEYELKARKQGIEGMPLVKGGVLNILIIGSDYMKGRETMGERADALVAVNIDKDKKTIKVLTIPRDTYTLIAGRNRPDKINHALTYGGWNLQKETVENFLDIKFDYTAFLNVNQVRDVAYIARTEISTGVITDVLGEMGFIDSLAIAKDQFYQKLHLAVIDRSDADAAVGRAKRHAKIVANTIKAIQKSCRDPARSPLLLDRSRIGRMLGRISYTNLTPEEVLSICSDLRDNDYSIEVYYIPGEPKRVKTPEFVALNKKGLSCWIPKDYGSGNYFSSVVADRSSRIAA